MSAPTIEPLRIKFWSIEVTAHKSNYHVSLKHRLLLTQSNCQITTFIADHNTCSKSYQRLLKYHRSYLHNRKAKYPLVEKCKPSELRLCHNQTLSNIEAILNSLQLSFQRTSDLTTLDLNTSYKCLQHLKTTYQDMQHRRNANQINWVFCSE